MPKRQITGLVTGDKMQKTRRVEIELLATGDILLLATDGLTEHGEGAYVAEELPRYLRRVQDLPAADIACQLKESIRAFASPHDDVTAVVVKRV